MTPIYRALFVVALWAAIYLPALGVPEIKGEEGRRILPAVAMLDTGRWLVPTLNGEPYLRKPPLINWAIAGSMRLFGQRSEWAARLPSTLGLLGLALLTLAAVGGWRGGTTGVAAAAFLLTGIGLIAKGREAEIEPLYVAFTGGAILVWVAGYARGGNRWARWLAVGPLLGLGLLLKGPFHLLFFVAIAVGVIVRTARAGVGGGGVMATVPQPVGRAVVAELLSPAALVAAALAAAMFLAWAIPYARAVPATEAADVWRGQTVGRLAGAFDFWAWLANIPRAVADLLPWVVFAPLWWWRDRPVAGDPVLAGMRDGWAVCFFGVLLVPGVLPRYVLPLAPVAAVLLAVAALNAPAAWVGLWRRLTPWGRDLPPSGLALRGTAAIGLVVLVGAAVSLSVARRWDNVRPVGAGLQAVAGDGPLYVLDVGYQPALFYVRVPLVYLRDETELKGRDGARVVVPPKLVDKLGEMFAERRVLAEFAPPNAKPLLVVEVRGAR